jgi:hypothetical protein
MLVLFEPRPSIIRGGSSIDNTPLLSPRLRLLFTGQIAWWGYLNMDLHRFAFVLVAPFAHPKICCNVALPDRMQDLTTTNDAGDLLGTTAVNSVPD